MFACFNEFTQGKYCRISYLSAILKNHHTIIVVFPSISVAWLICRFFLDSLLYLWLLFQISYERATDTNMKQVMTLAHHFLQVFCKGNTQNQALLHKNLSLFMTPGVSI